MELESLLDTVVIQTQEETAHETMRTAHQQDVQSYAASQWSNKNKGDNSGKGVSESGKLDNPVSTRRLGVIIPQTGLTRRSVVTGPSSGSSRHPLKISPPMKVNKPLKFTGTGKTIADKGNSIATKSNNITNQLPVITKKTRVHSYAQSIITNDTSSNSNSDLHHTYEWNVIPPPMTTTTTSYSGTAAVTPIQTEVRYMQGEEENMNELLVINSRNLINQIRRKLKSPIITPVSNTTSVNSHSNSINDISML